MSNNFFIITQSFSENKGSFQGFFEDLAREAYRRGYKVTILCRKINKDQKNEEQLEYAKVIRFPFYNIRIFNMAFNEIIFSFRIRSFFKKIKLKETDIIFSNGGASLGVLNKSYVLRSQDQPAMTINKSLEISKNNVSFLGRLFRFLHYFIWFFLDKPIVGNAIGILFSSEESRNEFIKYYGCKEKPYFIPNKPSKIYNKEKKYNKIVKSILFIAKGEERIRKGIYYLEKILPEIFESFPNLNLIHIGDKSEWNLPKKYIGRINHIGTVQNNKMKEYYLSADIFLLCSISEGIPAVIPEAMSFGCPIISSDIIGIKEYIVHKKEGYIFKRGDSEDLKKAIIFMLKNPKQRIEMGKRAKEKAKKFDSKRFYKYLFDFIEHKNKNYNLLK